MRVLCYTVFAVNLLAVFQIFNAHAIKQPTDHPVEFIDYIYDSQPHLMEYDISTSNDKKIDDKTIKANIRDILERNNLDVNLKKYKTTRHHDRKKISPDYLNDHPYASVHFAYHDDIDENNHINDSETDELVKKLFYAIENNELLELYVECAKFSRLKEQYYHQKGGRNEKKRFNRQVFDEIENFCEFIKIDGEDFIM